MKCDWSQPELALVNPNKLFASYFPSPSPSPSSTSFSSSSSSSSSSSRSNPSRSSRKDLKSSSSSSSSVPPRRRIKNEEDYDNGAIESEEEQPFSRPRRQSTKPTTQAVAPDSDASGSEFEEDDEDYEGSEQEMEEADDEDVSEKEDDGECSSTSGTPLKRKVHAVARSKAKSAFFAFISLLFCSFSHFPFLQNHNAIFLVHHCQAPHLLLPLLALLQIPPSLHHPPPLLPLHSLHLSLATILTRPSSPCLPHCPYLLHLGPPYLLHLSSHITATARQLHYLMMWMAPSILTM